MNRSMNVRRALLLLGAAVVLSACGKHDDSAAAMQAAAASGPQSTAADPLARGRYLVKAADCAACHTTSDGAPFAGGVKLASPFGTFYGTNITPDKDHGIGNWSANDLYKALHDGVAPTKQLYPAMPYTSYRQLSRADSDAIYAYLMAQKPAAVANHEPELSFPFNMRFGVRFWNWMFLTDALPDASKGQSSAGTSIVASADWNRGRYLVSALGHCAECHTPRGKFGQLDGAKPLTGAALGRIAAPDITPQGLAARGWTAADLQMFFATGIAPQGSAFGEMYPVVHLSSQSMTHDDLRAMSAYLLGDKAPAPQPLQSVSADTAQLEAGRNVYLAVCAGCHGLGGEGKPHVAVPMHGNSTVRQSDAHNLIVAMLDGIGAQDFPGLERMQEMPGFATQLSDTELAQLANYLRATHGGQPADVTADAVQALR
ncbi:cytochrome c [Paraburkholderia caffeinilytica]|uniref:Cytochrome c n=1 Tax=Paraburkholderia caffeinilytica TaxID=1761016 RepID=A0ABQ1NC97_9BURK|nr:cytochrome c [Paraburkholderia caffeinilytica]GGC60541.1 cytochrome c [Paraburkholderia caffeinilytica]CAB3795072.1 Alcohol dehydrogenase (quinone), cytochrome c subunit [Paraburkholderia caffeinilytica]